MTDLDKMDARHDSHDPSKNWGPANGRKIEDHIIAGPIALCINISWVMEFLAEGSKISEMFV